MEFTAERIAGGMVIRLFGKLDVEAGPALESILKASLDTKADRLIVDMKAVTYVTSVCLRVLLAAAKRVRQEERFMELIRMQPEVRRLLLVVGLGDLLPLGEGSMQIADILKQRNAYNDLALRNARHFLGEMFAAMGVKKDRAEQTVERVFDTIQSVGPLGEIEASLKKLLAGLNIPADRLRQAHEDRAKLLHGQIEPYVGPGSILDVGAGDGLVGKTFASEGRLVELLDVADRNESGLPLEVYDGRKMPFPDKSFDYALMISMLHHCDDPAQVLREARRVTRRRVIVNEPVYLNEPQRRYNMFFDWFMTRVAGDFKGTPCNFNSPEGWEHVFRELGYRVAASVDIGLDMPVSPEYHWLYALDVDPG
ncbi:MAG TPA: anti-sigma factor antagonist [Candidatus Brocadiia bacterium]|nr:anti-sigma factor antagonist [Candidatus Brocadiia bacterium]